MGRHQRKGIDRHVTQLSAECTQSMHADIGAGVSTTWSTGRFVLDIAQHGQSSAASRR